MVFSPLATFKAVIIVVDMAKALQTKLVKYVLGAQTDSEWFLKKKILKITGWFLH